MASVEAATAAIVEMMPMAVMASDEASTMKSDEKSVLQREESKVCQVHSYLSIQASFLSLSMDGDREFSRDVFLASSCLILGEI